jgi:hypothetical protein
MGTLKINICPVYPYECYTNFWDLYGNFNFYVTVKSTEASKITSIRIIGRYRTSKLCDFNLFIQDVRILNQECWGAGEFTFEKDVSQAISPHAGEVGEKSNKIGFQWSNVGFPFVGNTDWIEEAYLEIEYTGEPPPAPTPSVDEGGSGVFNLGNLDEMFAMMIQLMMVIMVMNMMSGMIGGFTD